MKGFIACGTAGRTEARMTPSYVTGTDLRVGLPVEDLGESDPVPVLDEKLQAIGLALYSGHPGRIWNTTIQHI